MKLLLDENLDHALRNLLGKHEVVTVSHMGWNGLKNGELLSKAEENGFEVLLPGINRSTMSRALPARISRSLPIIKGNLSKIVDAIDNAVPGSFEAVDCGTFSRKKPGQ